MDYASFIKEIGRGAKGARPLTHDQAENLFGQILDGKVPDMELGSILIALRIKGESPEEIRGFLAALQARTRQISLPEGPRCVMLPTYNGARKQANLMPLVALLLARDGIPVLIHGRHDFESRTSPFELLAALGIQTESSLPAATSALGTHKIACVRLDMLARGLDWLVSLRQRLGVRNCGHTLAKLLDPGAQRSVRVIPVTHPAYMESMQTVLKTEHAHALLMRGTEGEAYANPRKRPRMLGFSDGNMTELYPAVEGVISPIEDSSCSVDDNARTIRAMLAGKTEIPSPIQDQISAIKHLALQ